MDLTRLLILIVGFIIIIAFSIYSFMESSPSSPPLGTNIEPEGKIIITPSTEGTSVVNSTDHLRNSMQPHFLEVSARYDTIDYHVKHIEANNSAVQSSPLVMNVFRNKDMPENYYSIALPSSGTVVHGNAPGDIIYRSKNVTSSVELQDIPDDSNVELFTLTHTEPALKSSVSNYKLISSEKLNAGGNRGWNIIYTWKNSSQDVETVKAIVEGKDQAAVISFTSQTKDYPKNNSTINSILENFQWLEQ